MGLYRSLNEGKVYKQCFDTRIIKSGTMDRKMKKSGARANDVSNEAVLFMLVLVIIVSLVSMIVYVNLLSHVDKRVTAATLPADSAQGVVSLRILPPPAEQGEIETSEADAHE